MHVTDWCLFTNRLADLTAKDKEKKLLEKAKNELESYIYDAQDKLSQDVYEKCSTEEEREKYSGLLSEASDWLYEVEEDTPKQVNSDTVKYKHIWKVDRESKSDFYVS